MTVQCSRCGARLPITHSLRVGKTLPCTNETCAGTMRRVLNNDVRREATAKRELKEFGCIA